MSAVTDLASANGTAAAPHSSRRPRTPHRGVGASRPKAVAGRTISILSTVMVVVAIAGFLFLAVGPRVFGYQTSTMLTGSMSPLINPGDVVVTVPTPISEIHVGDVITYRIPIEDHRVETHRVAEILANADGSIAVRTKGDANRGTDPWSATLQGTTVDRHVLTVPSVGQAIRNLRQPLVLNTLMYGASAVLVIGLLASIWRKDPEPSQNA